jgi:hypothetical protein
MTSQTGYARVLVLAWLCTIACACSAVDEAAEFPSARADLTACSKLTQNGLRTSDKLARLWGTRPREICRYDSLRGAGADRCGARKVGNAVYCAHEDAIEYDRLLARILKVAFGRFAMNVILAHEWGHLNQFRFGLRMQRSEVDREIHADCQAGIYMGLVEYQNRIDAADGADALDAFCAIGEDATWFARKTHGSCQERVLALGRGIAGVNAEPNAFLAGGQRAIAAMRRICGE